MNKECNKCGDALVVGSTTSEAMLKRYDYRCMACRRTLDKPYEQARERIRPPDLERKRLWKKENQGYVKANNAKRRADKELRTPSWCDLYKVQKFYEMAAWLNSVHGPNTWHVDHVIPLKGKLVSGLHVHNNLQLLPAAENIMKNNKWDVQLQR